LSVDERAGSSVGVGDTVILHASDGTLVATVSGEVDEVTAPEIATRVESEATAASACDVVIDLRRVTFIGSTGLSMLLGIRRDVCPRPVRLVVNPASMTARLLRITDLGEVFPLHRQVSEALIAARTNREDEAHLKSLTNGDSDIA
jgi:anti-sigma B factor antagonist